MGTSDRYQSFIRKVVDNLAEPELPNALTAEERVNAAVTITNVFLEDEGLDLSAENAVKIAAIIAAAASSGA